MSDNTKVPRMDPIELPAAASVNMQYSEGEFVIEVTTPDGEEAPISRIELTTLLGMAIMSIGYDAHAQDLEQE